MLDNAQLPKPTKPSRYAEANSIEPKVRLGLDHEYSLYDDIDALTEEANYKEFSLIIDDSLDRAFMSIEDYRSHELRHAKGRVIDQEDRYEVQCSAEDIEEMLRIASQLLANPAQSTCATFHFDKFVLDIQMIPDSKSKISKAVSQTLTTNGKGTSTRRTLRKAKVAARNFGLDAFPTDDLSLLEPLLSSVEKLKTKLTEQLDELKVIKKSFMRRMQTLENTRKIEESIDLTRRYEMSACSTPRPGSRLADDKTTSNQEDLEAELAELQMKLKACEEDHRNTSRISTRISRIKTELQFLKTKNVISRTKTITDRRNPSLDFSFSFPSERPQSSCSIRRGPGTGLWDECNTSAFRRPKELEHYDDLHNTSVTLSSDLMKEQLSVRREKQELEEQRMKIEIEADASKRKLEIQAASVASQKEQLETERRQLNQERSQHMQMNREYMRRRSQLQSMYQALMSRIEELRLSPHQANMLKDLKDQLLS